ncbi:MULTISPECIES: hypothetical protein [unclassified Thiocapsa]
MVRAVPARCGLVFAGEHVSALPAWIEGAVQSAHAGVALLQQRWESPA